MIPDASHWWSSEPLVHRSDTPFRRGSGSFALVTIVVFGEPRT